MTKRTAKVSDAEMIKGTLLPCMDYLHGDVVDDQFRAACHYEYARESHVLGRAAQVLTNNPTADTGEITLQIESEFDCGSWFIQPDWVFIWQCPSFPEKGWNQLSEAERTELLYGLPCSTTKVQPLLLGEVIFLTPYLDQLKELADKARAEWEQARVARKPRQKVHPILELKNSPFVQVLVALDYRKSRKRLLQEIDLWLQLPENKDRFNKHRPKTEAGTEKQAKDRLKDLAAWRLFKELGWEEAIKFAEQHRKRDKKGEPKAFHDPRQGRRGRGELTKIPLNEAPLYSWQTGEPAFRKAKGRIDRYLAELIPWEFGTYAKEAGTYLTEMVERFKQALKEAQKTSTNSSQRA
jgi:hypothetical protein